MVVSVIGLGGMGRAMAERLAARGFTLRVWNRSREKAAGLRATICDNPSEAARGAEVVLTSLSNDEVVREVVLGNQGVLAGLGAEAVHAGASTISHALARELVAEFGRRDRTHVSSPVIGRPEAAVEGKLFVLAGGAPAALERCRPLFAAVAQRTFDFAEPAQANLVKILVNLQLAGTIELLGEVFAASEKAGLPPDRLLEVLTSTLFGCPAVNGYGPRIVSGSFEPAGFRMPLGLKDVQLALALGDELRAPLPAASVVRDHLLAALAAGLDKLDWSGFTRVVRGQAGLR